jgi:peptidyl-prolyl cis-trans isomerase B (cyclophilin B)
MMKQWRWGLLVLFGLMTVGAKSPNIILSTTFGEIELSLAVKEAPQHSRNFFLLSWLGFYDGLTFHRLVPGFVIQGGDPSGDGTGGPGYTIPAEIGLPHDEGVLAAARTSDQVNPKRESSGSQFYITVAPTHQLDGAYSVYGKTVKGMDVVKKIVEQPRDARDKPLTPIVIKGAMVMPQAVSACGGWKLSVTDSGVSLTKNSASVAVSKEKASAAMLFCEPVISGGEDVPVAWVTTSKGAGTLSVYQPGEPITAYASLTLQSPRKIAFWDLNGDGVKEVLLLQSRPLTGEAASVFGGSLALPIVICVKDAKAVDCTADFKALALAYRGLGLKMMGQKEGQAGKVRAGAAIIWIANQWLGSPQATPQMVANLCKTCVDDLKAHEADLKNLMKPL